MSLLIKNNILLKPHFLEAARQNGKMGKWRERNGEKVDGSAHLLRMLTHASSHFSYVCKKYVKENYSAHLRQAHKHAHTI
jgi:hypothetical protein